MEAIGIYLHIPFCLSKCPYCDFYSVPAREELLEAYTGVLCKAIAEAPASAGTGANTVYFGGGTPILLGAKRIARILAVLRSRFSLQNPEITLEANPHSTLLPTLCALREAGVNRLSFGVQSAVAGQLRLLGRTHTAQAAKTAVEQARAAGFENLSLDIMLGLPGQVAADIEETVGFCTDLEPEHISAYILKIEPGTPFASRFSPEDVDEDLQADLYLQTVSLLERAGYGQYEISNFAKPGFESVHNLKYWNGDHYLGIGPAASSFLDQNGGERFSFPRDLQGFLQADKVWELVQSEGAGGDFQEYAMLRLRLRDGLIFSEAQRRYPQAELETLRHRAQALKSQGLCSLFVPAEDRLALTAQGMLVSNGVIASLLL